MTKIDITAQVLENTVDELNSEIKNLIENKYGGKVEKAEISDSNSTSGSGAMLRRDN